MSFQTKIRLVFTLILLAIVPLSLTALAHTDGLANRSLAIARFSDPIDETDVTDAREPGVENELALKLQESDGPEEPVQDELDEDSWDEEAWDEEAEEHEGDEDEFQDFEQLNLAREMAALADSKAATVAYALQLLVDSTDEEYAANSLEQILKGTDDELTRRLITIRLAETYVELEQTAKLQPLLEELCR